MSLEFSAARIDRIPLPAVQDEPANNGAASTGRNYIAELNQSTGEGDMTGKLLEVLLQSFPGGIAFYDADLRLLMSNAEFARLLNLPDAFFDADVLTMEDFFRFNAERGEYGPGDPGQYVAKRVARTREREPHQYERTRPDGTVLEIRGAPVEGGGFVTTYFDVTEKRRKVQQLEAVVEHFPGGICLFDEDLELAVWNDQMVELLEYPQEQFVTNKPSLRELFEFKAKRGEYGPGPIEKLVEERMERARRRVAHEYRRERPNGTVLEVRGAPIKKGGFVTTYFDITEKCRDERMIAHLAHHDPLTNLPNRLLFNDRLRNATSQAKRGMQMALHYVDLDTFKPVNDAFGHAVGDKLLRAVAERLNYVVRETDTVARLGGDEFVIIEVGIQDIAGAESLAQRLIEALCRPFDVDGHTVQIGASIGIALAPHHSVDPEELIKLADEALYRAKAAGRQIYRFAEPPGSTSIPSEAAE